MTRHRPLVRFVATALLAAATLITTRATRACPPLEESTSDLPPSRIYQPPTMMVPNDGRLGRQFRRRAHRSGGYHQRRPR